MPFQSAHERFLRDKVAGAERLALEIGQRKDAEQQRFMEFERGYKERLAALDQELMTSAASLAAYRESLGNFLTTRPELSAPRRKMAGHRGRGVSARWRELFAKLPSAPEQGLTAAEFTGVVQQINPNIQPSAVRSQLSTAKKRGRLENIEGRWRRIGGNDSEEIEASDDTSVPHRPSEASNGAGAWAAPETT